MLDQLSPPAGPRPGGQGLRVAIVGLGPKGMFALERLLDHAARADGGVPIEVDAFEPHPVPGAGPVYDPGQPAHLRMNFAAGAVDMWWPGSRAAPPAERRSFVDWCAARGAPCDAAGYPPRATVGRYLADGLRTLLAHAPPNVTVTVHPTRVQAVRRVGSAWDLALAGHSPGTDRSPAPAGPGRYDEVLLATGHDDSWDGALANGWGGPARLAAGVFPVDRWLTAERIPAGATVAVRGFALSFIDAALALTEGRGGSFEPRDDDRRGRPEGGRLPLPEACRLAYRPGSDDVGVILPFSRTGRPMLAKPAAGLARSIPGLDELARRGRRRLSGLDEPVSLCGDLLPILAAVARANLRAASAAPEHAAGVDSWLDAATAGLPAAGDHGPADELRQSLAIGAGLIAPDLQWALGQTWRTLYPALVERLGGDRLASADWPAFRRLAAALERISFGPPPINAAKLLALVEAGRVDLTHVRGGRLVGDRGISVLCTERGRIEVDAVVDAVLPGPGAGPGQNALLRRLIDDGHARVAPGRRGIEVTPDGSCRRADGSAAPGLAAIGRPTEDSVIGNDTLSRTLHPGPDLWARRIVERYVRSSATGILAGVGEPG